MAEHLFLEERRRVILDQLEKNGRVEVKNLSEALGVSSVTIRQDLRALEDEGLLERTYGGAVMRTTITPDRHELSFNVRRNKNRAEKDAIGQVAAAMVKTGYAIALDASTTVCSVLPYLDHLDGLTIVTNNLMVSQLLLKNPRIHVLLPAGRLRRDSNSVVGNPNTLPDINLNIGFLSAWGISYESGLTEVNADETAMKQALIARCKMTIVLADSSKWGHIAPYTYATANDIDQIITGDNAPPDMVEQFRGAGVQIETTSAPDSRFFDS